MFGDAFLTCANHFRVCKPQKQLVLSGNIYGQHSDCQYFGSNPSNTFHSIQISNNSKGGKSTLKFKKTWLDEVQRRSKGE